MVKFYVVAISSQNTAEIQEVSVNQGTLYSRLDGHLESSYPDFNKDDLAKSLAHKVRLELLAGDQVNVNEITTMCGLLINENLFWEGYSMVILNKDSINLLVVTVGMDEKLQQVNPAHYYQLIDSWKKLSGLK